MLGSLITSEALALGGIGGGRSAKARNNNGIQAIHAYVCVNLDCSQSNIKIVEKCATHAHMENGICYCDEGYLGDGETCTESLCSPGQKPDKNNEKCLNCEADQICATCKSRNIFLPNGDGNGNCVCSDTSCGTNHYCEEGVCQMCVTPTKSCQTEVNVIDPDTKCITTVPMICEGETCAEEVKNASTEATIRLMDAASLGHQENTDITEVAARIDCIADMTLPTYDGKDKAYIKLDFNDKEVCKQFKNTFTSTDDYVVLGLCEDEADEIESKSCRYSPCQTCVEDELGTQIRGFEPSGTACEQSGLKGKCDGYGQCIPTEGEDCSDVDGCPSGYFCNYKKSGSSGGGKISNKCEKVNPKIKTVDGVTYYYASIVDLKSWCRPADENVNCIWGYLTLEGAKSWCKSIGKRLLTIEEYMENKEELMKVLPQFSSGAAKYWVQGGEPRDDGTVWSGRPDGYAGVGGVVCK